MSLCSVVHRVDLGFAKPHSHDGKLHCTFKKFFFEIFDFYFNCWEHEHDIGITLH